MEQKLLKLKEEAIKLIEKCANNEEIEKLRVQFLGKKCELTAILRSMASLSEEERPIIGKVANEVRAAIENGINEFKAAWLEKQKEEKLKNEKVDVTMPSKYP